MSERGTMATMKDIAREAGVSAMTVSRVLNKRYDLVSGETIQKVEKLIQKYNYIPNSAARSLSSRSARIIAIFIKGDSGALGHSLYNSTILGYLIDRIQEQGYDTMVHLVTRYEDVLDKLQSWKASGALFFGMLEQDIGKISSNTTIPLIFMDCYSHDRQIINVGIDDRAGGLLAGRYLLEHGHTNLAFSNEGLDDSPVVSRRLCGFQSALRESGLELEPSHILRYEDPSELKKALTQIHGDHLAVFCHSDLHAVKLMQCILELGYSIPEDFSVIGFDDLPVCEWTTPRLTSISQDISEKADRAVDLLIKYLAEPGLPMQNILLQPGLTERKSVRFFRLRSLPGIHAECSPYTGGTAL